MRNLKRVLSLTLASVMLLGLMVVGAGAVDYPDVDVNDNIEAIEVMGALGIFEGDDNGEFRPDDEVTRAEMAKVMATLLGLDYQHFEGLHPFTDTVGHWAEAYIAACTANGVINGRGGGIYDPSATVTGVEASAMLMRAMGYFKYASDVAEGFDIATIAQANKIGLYSDIDASVYSGLPRNEVAQMVLNALQCTMVEVGAVATTVTTPDGTVVNTGRTRYDDRTSDDINGNAGTSNFKYDKIAGNTGSGNITYTIELGEELYDGKLEKTGAEDAFGRKATMWRYNNKEIGTYNDVPELVYTKAVKGKDIWTDLGKPSETSPAPINTYYRVDGDTTRRYMGDYDPANLRSVHSDGSENVYFSGKGVVTTVYFDRDKNEVDLFMVNTFLAKVEADYDEEDDSLAIDVQSNFYDFETELDGEKFAISGYEKGDYLLVTATCDGKIQSVSPATVVSGVTVDEYKDESTVVTSDGSYDYAYVLYKDAGAMGYELARKSGTKDYDLDGGEYDLYLDQYGYVIGIDGVSSSSDNLDDYLFITDVDKELSTYKAMAVFMDGTSKVITVSKVGPDGDVSKVTGMDDIVYGIAGGVDIDEGVLTSGVFYSFKVDKSGNYELTSAGPNTTRQGVFAPGDSAATTVTYVIDADVTESALYPIGYADGDTLKAKLELAPVNSKTLFVIKDEVYVGVKNTPTVTWYDTSKDNAAFVNLYYMLDKDTNYIAALYVDAEDASASSRADDWFYIYDEGNTTANYVNYSAIQGTEKVSLKVDKDDTLASSKIPGLYKITSYTSDGYAKVNGTAKTGYFKAEDGDYNSTVYSVRLDAGEFTMKSGALIINPEGDVDMSYYVSEDAELYRLNANSSGKSVSSATKITVADIENMKSGKYDIYLILDKDGHREVKIAYFVKLG